MSIQLYDALKNFNNQDILDTDPRWRAFVIDHIDIIRNESIKQFVSNDILTVCEKNIRRLLIHYSYEPELEWVFKLVNDLNNDLDLLVDNNVGKTYIFPEISKIRGLLGMFKNQYANNKSGINI